ncbi:uncharacterized protein LOC129376546 [Poeciliopsis prolifica]|uniref:uncharacterized protein LOC129376546 n=1 Tax=Poeciliopsis prolifica TaxID=188132 RepID=UPI0024144A8D|nr:uncharacterized protein LOC129376546 [Poeciliopsis prolifica]
MEEEMDDQRRLMDFTRIPKIILHRIDLPQCWVCKEEEDLNEFSIQERKSTSDKEEPESLQMKQEQQEPEPLQIKQDQEEPEHQELKEEEKQLCISQDEEHLVLKLETDDILMNPLNVQRIYNETEPQRNQLISHGSAEDENQDQEGSNSEDPGKKRDEEQKQNRRYKKTKQQKIVYSFFRADKVKHRNHLRAHEGAFAVL